MRRIDILNKRIQYRKSGSRHGWTGEIVDAWKDNVPGGVMVKILYDNGVVQNYCIEALEGFGIPRMHPEAAGYLHIIGGPGKIDAASEVLKPTHFVQGENGGPMIRCYSEAEAHETAKSRAQSSKSGQAYLVMKVASKYQRSEPPVERTDF